MPNTRQNNGESDPSTEVQADRSCDQQANGSCSKQAVEGATSPTKAVKEVGSPKSDLVEPGDAVPSTAMQVQAPGSSTLAKRAQQWASAGLGEVYSVAADAGQELCAPPSRLACVALLLKLVNITKKLKEETAALASLPGRVASAAQEATLITVASMSTSYVCLGAPGLALGALAGVWSVRRGCSRVGLSLAGWQDRAEVELALQRAKSKALKAFLHLFGMDLCLRTVVRVVLRHYLKNEKKGEMESVVEEASQMLDADTIRNLTFLFCSLGSEMPAVRAITLAGQASYITKSYAWVSDRAIAFSRYVLVSAGVLNPPHIQSRLRMDQRLPTLADGYDSAEAWCDGGFVWRKATSPVLLLLGAARSMTSAEQLARAKDDVVEEYGTDLTIASVMGVFVYIVYKLMIRKSEKKQFTLPPPSREENRTLVSKVSVERPVVPETKVVEDKANNAEAKAVVVEVSSVAEVKAVANKDRRRPKGILRRRRKEAEAESASDCSDSESHSDPDTSLMEAKSLAKGKGKTKGRAQGVRATGARRKKVLDNKRDRKRLNAGRLASRGAVHSADWWYDDDVVEVYDPVSARTLSMRMDADGVRKLRDKAIRAGKGAEFSLYNTRTGATVTGDGHVTAARPDVTTWGEDLERMEEERRREDDAYLYDDHYYEEYPDDGSDFAMESVRFESSLGKACIRDSALSLRLLHHAGLEEGKPGAHMVGCVYGCKVLVMKHWLDNTPSSTFNCGEHRIQKEDVRPVPGDKTGELMCFQKPMIGKSEPSTRIKLSEPKNDGGDCVISSRNMDGKLTSSGSYTADGHHTCFTENGWCGSPVIHTGNGGPLVVGWHYIGDDGTGTNGFIPVNAVIIQFLKSNGFPTAPQAA